MWVSVCFGDGHLFSLPFLTKRPNIERAQAIVLRAKYKELSRALEDPLCKLGGSQPSTYVFFLLVGFVVVSM